MFWDALFTLMILDLKGWEANPVVSSVITLYGQVLDLEIFYCLRLFSPFMPS